MLYMVDVQEYEKSRVDGLFPLVRTDDVRVHSGKMIVDVVLLGVFVTWCIHALS